MLNENTSASQELILPNQKGYEVRRVWYKDTWWYSIVDIIRVLEVTIDPTDYWTKMKRRGRNEGFETTLQQIIRFKLKSRDGRFRETDCATREIVFRLLQSIPSQSQTVEDCKLWLAELGEERMQKIENNPEAAIEQEREKWRKKGRDEKWIKAKIQNQLIRNELTDQWSLRGAQQTLHYGILTNSIHKGTFGIPIKEHKKVKRLPEKANPRDHFDNIELSLLSLAEATSTELHRQKDSQGFNALLQDTYEAGQVGSIARQAVEKTLGRSAINSKNFLDTPRKTKPDRHQNQLLEQCQKQPTLFDEPNIQI